MLWAKALETHLPGVGARNMVAPIVGGSIFESTEPVPLGAFHLSRTWQKAEFDRVCEFTHVMVESQRPMFGGLFGYQSMKEIRELLNRGVSVALMSHGSDTRDPRAHSTRTPWSPFRQQHPDFEVMQEIADRTRREMSELGLPVFVSTPDLLDDLPQAHWCPLIVDSIFEHAKVAPLLKQPVPVVTHIPSGGWSKGTDLVTPIATGLARSGVIDFRPVSNIPRVEMPAAMAAADILLEQFRIGSYGATAIEAMALGRVVVGHILPSVREKVRAETGLELPIVEATADTLEAVLTELASDPARLLRIGQQGKDFTRQVHDGRMSAAVLSKNWINREN